MAMKDRVKELRRVPASELGANPKNWRRHPPSQEAALRGVLEDIGFADAVIARETDDGLELIDGHLRQEVMGDQVVPVLIVDVTEEEADKMLLTYDPLAMMAHADQDQLLHLLRDTQFESQAVNDMLEAVANGERLPMPDLTEPVEDPGPQIDRADELREKWQTERGQVWEVGRHRLMCGDNQEGLDALLDGAALDIVLTDPPYGIEIVRGLGAAGVMGKVGHGGKMGPALLRGTVGVPGVVEPRLYHPVYGDDQPFDPDWLMDLAPVLVLFGANHYASRLPDAPGWIVWDKGISPEANFSACELIWTNKGNHVRRYEWRWSGMIRQGARDIEMKDRIHPTQKPVGLISEILRDFTVPDDRVLDPYLGSGTTMLAAELTGRICYGAEYDDGYVAVTLERMAGMGLEPKLDTG